MKYLVVYSDDPAWRKQSLMCNKHMYLSDAMSNADALNADGYRVEIYYWSEYRVDLMFVYPVGKEMYCIGEC